LGTAGTRLFTGQMHIEHPNTALKLKNKNKKKMKKKSTIIYIKN